MHIRSKPLSLIWKAAIAVCAFVGLGLQAGVFRGELNLSIFRYFTNLSNLLCMLYFIADAIYILSRRADDGSQNWFPPLKGAVMMAVVVTCLVAHIVLGKFDMGASMRVSIFFVHTLVPVMTVLDWLLFGEKGRMRISSPLLWAVFPLGYFLVVMLLAQFSAGVPFYPYPFMNAETLGLWRVLVNVSVMTAVFVALGYGLVLIDHLLAGTGGRIKEPAGLYRKK
jgi:hypothetical protein